MPNYVVAGVTGRVGATVARELLGRGEGVTAIVRNETQAAEWTRRGAEVARGSLDDRAFVARVAQDAEGFFALLPENVPPEHFHGARRRMADAIAAGVQDGGVPHVVLLSAIAAVLPDGNGPAKDLHYCEQQLRLRARQLTTLRACYFQDNVAGVIPAAAHAGIYPNFFASADAPVPMIATRDVGRFAAHALMRPSPYHEIIDLLGPVYTIRQVARELGRVLERGLQIVTVPSEHHSATLVQAGIPKPVADAIAEMFAAINAGLIAPRGDRQLIGSTPIEQVITQYARNAS